MFVHSIKIFTMSRCSYIPARSGPIIVVEIHEIIMTVCIML